MSATYESVQPKPTASASKPLWAAVGVLGVTVLAMGATLINIQNRHEEPGTAVLPAVMPAPSTANSSGALPAPASASALTGDHISNSAQKRAEAPVNHAQLATKYVAQKAPRTTGANGAADLPRAQAARPVCANCGTVASVTPIERDGTASGGGAVAGGVLGAVVGNQVGGGNGKTLATILGAVGGGYAGTTVEKKMRKETVYQVRVRMEDGSSRTLEQATPASLGAKVIVEGRTLQPAGR